MSFLSLHMHLVLIMMLSLAFSGCSKPSVYVAEYPRSVTGIEAGDGITVVRVHRGPGLKMPEWLGLEGWIGNCISSAMVKRNLSVRFIPPGEFRRAVFPDLDRTSAPMTRESILELLDSHQIRDKVASLNLRYLIIVDHWSGASEVSRRGDSMTTPPILVSEVDFRTALLAEIIDLRKAADSGDVRVAVQKRGYCGCVCFFPVVLPRFTEGRACKTLGQAVTKFLLGEKNGELSK